nr:C->U-editing enzyme APOBEC-1-like [Zootoca vivipara]XP_034971739.1 C->U-editing enzyme APOBEC-1-like [Zootoca vivipara]XP_034971740.1 C->U-editing enzyme APOBEC-1-like [Zootoca vivipara]XP_034971741.1 C->U-editing enzyme APOBEC-1-like [Zootoca vivipara]
MPFALKELLPKEDFQEHFNNTRLLNKTLLLFSFKKEEKRIWEIWGYAYNDPRGKHAEVLVLDYIEDHIAKNKTKGKYELNFFVSYAPCHECSARIKSFMAQRSGICMEIRASKPYFFYRERVRKGLHLLKSSGVSIKMMNKSDYRKCLYLFVHPSENFTPWSNLDEQSKENANDLDTLLKQEEENDKMIDSDSISARITQLGAQENSEPDIPLDGHCQSPAMERNKLSEPETPRKLNRSPGTREVVSGIKRKLDFSED